MRNCEREGSLQKASDVAGKASQQSNQDRSRKVEPAKQTNRRMRQGERGTNEGEGGRIADEDDRRPHSSLEHPPAGLLLLCLWLRQVNAEEPMAVSRSESPGRADRC